MKPLPWVTMAAMDNFNLDSDKVNIHGACALGHPVGFYRARVLF